MTRLISMIENLVSIIKKTMSPYEIMQLRTLGYLTFIFPAQPPHEQAGEMNTLMCTLKALFCTWSIEILGLMGQPP